MNRAHISSSNLINEKLEEHQISTAKHCPNCHHKIDSKPVRKIPIPFCLCIYLCVLAVAPLCGSSLGFGDTCKAQLVLMELISVTARRIG
jgi:DNA-directed RNA polymerase subunit RPC12/RpoP